ncbi:MAG: hypothetical protein AB1540_10010 [Bdellovibrionota bacterium]
MLYRIPKSVIPILVCIACATAYAGSSRRKATCYHLNENFNENPQRFDAHLCIESQDLKKYPNSVVTVTFRSNVQHQDPAQKGGSVYAPQYVKRHYSNLGKGRFGSKARQKPMVIFDQSPGQVHLGFVGPQGRSYHYKQAGSAAQQALLKAQARDQTLRSGTLGKR